MKLIFALLLLLSCALPAQAQSCAPAEVAGATGQPLRTAWSLDGWWGYTFCVDDYSVRFKFAYASPGSVLRIAADEITQARMSVDAFEAAFLARATGRHCRIEGGEMHTDGDDPETPHDLCFALMDDMLAHWPPTPMWRVVPLLTGDGSRPMYPVIDGVRSTKEDKTTRAPPSALCGCTRTTALPSGTTRNRWCPVEARPNNLVALCSRTQ